MARRITATITVEGDAARLAAYRRRANELLEAEFDEPYRELHTAGRLHWQLKGAGVPYPPFVTASAELPELVVEVQWDEDGAGGRATIQGGRLTQQTAAAGPAAGTDAYELRVDRDGTLALAVACRGRQRGEGIEEWIGYAVTSTRHGFFHLERHGERAVLEATDGIAPDWAERWTLLGDRVDHAALTPRVPIERSLAAELDGLANDFADEWIWFAASPSADTAIERSRYAAYGLETSAANVRSVKLKTVLQTLPGGGFVLEAIDPAVRALAALVGRHWLQTDRH